MSSIKTTQLNGDLSIGRNVATGGNARIAGSIAVGHHLKVDGWLDAPNIKGANKGVFLTVEDLVAAYPSPQDGWFAGVGSSSPFALYVGKDGEWVDTEGTLDLDVDMTMYSEQVSQLLQDLCDVADAVRANEEATAGMAIQVFTTSRTGTYAIVQIKQAGHSVMTATINIATQEFAGLMSAADKAKLDSIDVASGLVAVVDIDDIDDLNTADCQLAATPTRYAVKKDTSRGTVVVALLDILSDDMRHVVTQVLTTHYVLSNGVLDTSTHMDTEVYRYYRSCKISGGTLPVEPGEWTPWQHLTPPMVALTQEAYDALVDEGKVKEDTYYYTYE